MRLPQQHAAWQTVLAALDQDDDAVLGDLVDAAKLMFPVAVATAVAGGLEPRGVLPSRSPSRRQRPT